MVANRETMKLSTIVMQGFKNKDITCRQYYKVNKISKLKRTRSGGLMERENN